MYILPETFTCGSWRQLTVRQKNRIYPITWIKCLYPHTHPKNNMTKNNRTFCTKKYKNKLLEIFTIIVMMIRLFKIDHIKPICLCDSIFMLGKKVQSSKFDYLFYTFRKGYDWLLYFEDCSCGYFGKLWSLLLARKKFAELD